MPSQHGFDEEVLAKAQAVIDAYDFRQKLAVNRAALASTHPTATVPTGTGIVDDGWMTTKEAAKYVKVSSRTILLWVTSGRLKGRQVGRNWKFKKSACDRALKEG